MTINLQLGERTAVADTLGGELISYRDSAGTEYIWQGDPAYWNGRNPLLFPIVGRLNGNRVMIDGKPYEMPQHGFARHSEFEVAESGADFVVFRLRESAATLAQFPYRFELLVRHTLTETGFSTLLNVRNTDDKPFHFCIGAHTGFRVPLLRGERFEEYSLVFEQIENLESGALTPDGRIDPSRTEAGLQNTDTLPLRHELFDIDTLIFEGLRSKSVTLRHNTKGHGIRLNFDGFPILSLWSMPHTDAPYLCIEPWLGTAAVDGESGDFADKPHAVALAAGKTFELGYQATTL